MWGGITKGGSHSTFTKPRWSMVHWVREITPRQRVCYGAAVTCRSLMESLSLKCHLGIETKKCDWMSLQSRFHFFVVLSSSSCFLILTSLQRTEWGRYSCTQDRKTPSLYCKTICFSFFLQANFRAQRQSCHPGQSVTYLLPLKWTPTIPSHLWQKQHWSSSANRSIRGIYRSS